jgi:hypothetical protein
LSLDTRLLLFAVAAQATLTFALAVWMAVLRGRDLRAGLDPQSIALREQRWSTRATQAAHSFSNQFELPVLFHVVSILFVVLLRPDLFVVVLAWVFVISRIVQALIHTTSNIVKWRGAAYGVGLLAVIVLWIYFIVLLATLPG